MYGQPPASLTKGSASSRDLSDLFVPNEGGKKRSYSRALSNYNSGPVEAKGRQVAGAPSQDQRRVKKSKKDKDRLKVKNMVQQIFNMRPKLTVIPEDEDDSQENCLTLANVNIPAEAVATTTPTSSRPVDVRDIPLPEGPSPMIQHQSDVQHITSLLKMEGDERTIDRAYQRMATQPTNEDPLRRAQNLLYKSIMIGRDIINRRTRTYCRFAPVHQQFYDLPENLRRDYYALVADISMTYSTMTPEAKDHAIERLLGYLWTWMNDGANQRIGREAMHIAGEEIKILQDANTHLYHEQKAKEREVLHYRSCFEELYTDYKDDDHPERRWTKRCKILNNYFELSLKIREHLYAVRRKEDKHYSPDIRTNLLVNSLRFDATVDEWYDVLRYTAEFHWAVLRKKEDESLEDFLMTNYEIVRSLYADVARDCHWPNYRRKLALFNRIDSRLRAFVIEKGVMEYTSDNSVNYQSYVAFLQSCEKELAKKKKVGRKKATGVSSAITVEPIVCDLCKEQGHDRNNCWEVITYDDGPLWQRLGHSHYTRQNWPADAPPVEEVLREQLPAENVEENGENNNGTDEYVPEYAESVQADEPPLPPGTE